MGDKNAGMGLDAQARFYDERWRDASTRLNHLQIARMGAMYEGLALVNRESKKDSFQICDLGCGTGWLTSEFQKFGPTTGIDLSPEGIEIAKSRWPGIEFLAGDVLEYQPEGRFDLVLSAEVIEHVPDQEAYVATCSRILNPGGYVILTCPNHVTKKAADKTGLITQPIEIWPTRRKLKALFKKDFDIRLHRTVVLDFGYSGIFRFTSAVKVLSMIRFLGLGHLYDGLRQTFAMGLHHMLVARKR